MQPTIILVDDEEEVVSLQKDALEAIGYHATAFTHPVAAWEFIRQRKIDLVVTDCNMPGMTGLELLFKTRSLEFPPDVIILTGFGTVPLAVKAMSEGAFGFLEKPFEISQYQNVIEHAIQRRQQRNSSLSAPAASSPRPRSEKNKAVFSSDKMTNVLRIASAAAATDSTVLLTGESGSGKEVLADYIHGKSLRAKGPIVKVNCGALPEHLVESELFGHEKGAFTGAEKRNIGRFEQANGGTLFLDEIGDLMLPLQVKLLRALQERTIDRIGSTTPIAVNFRLICATHRDLKQLVAQNRFREDLYYRINVMPIPIPALRERPDDIAPLAQYFFDSLRAKMNSGPSGIDASAMNALTSFTWPGNARQLRNAIEYALIVCAGSTIAPEHLPEEVRAGPPAPAPIPALTPAPATVPAPAPVPALSDAPSGLFSAFGSAPGSSSATAAASEPAHPFKPPTGALKQSVQEAEALAILAALERNKWRMTQTARDLNISRSTLYQRMQEFKIKR